MNNIDLNVDFSELDSILNPKMSLGIIGYIIKKEDYTNEQEDGAYNAMVQKITCEESLIDFYKRVSQDIKKPDLLGKTAQVTQNQFKKVYNMVKDIAGILNIVIPNIFVYQDVYYRADVDGFDTPWIEISAKLIEDFTDDELKFVLGKLLSSIQCKHYKYEAISNALNDVTNHIGIFDSFHLLDAYKLNLMPIINSWRRCICFSTDACGLLICGSFKAAVSAILKQILNNANLVSEINVRDYIEKSTEILQMTGKMVEYSKLDEAIPYGPYRILELLRYASSERCSRVLLELSRR